MKKVRVETQFLISVILLIVSGLCVTGLLIEELYKSNSSIENHYLNKGATSHRKAKDRYYDSLECRRADINQACLHAFSQDMLKIEALEVELQVYLNALAIQDAKRTGVPKLTIATLGFAVAALYCSFVLLQLRSNN